MDPVATNDRSAVMWVHPALSHAGRGTAHTLALTLRIVAPGQLKTLGEVDGYAVTTDALGVAAEPRSEI